MICMRTRHARVCVYAECREQTEPVVSTAAGQLHDDRMGMMSQRLQFSMATSLYTGMLSRSSALRCLSYVAALLDCWLAD